MNNKSTTSFQLIVESSAVLQTVIPDIDISTIKKNIVKKKHFGMVNVLRKSIGTTTITMQTFDLGVSFTVGELLASLINNSR